ncbi:MAG: NnrU family protein [Pseudomonadota bacterium]
MTVLVLGLVLFLGVHSLSALFAPARAELIEKRGAGFWKLPYAVTSFVGLIMIIWGYGAAREVPILLYQPPTWTAHLALVLMIFALILLVSAELKGNIARVAKHPQLAAVKIWASAHLLANGDLASVLLFGGFLAWAVFARISLKKRVAAGYASDNPGGPLRNDLLAVAVGLGLYVLFVVWAHEFLFGVAPIN